MKVLFDPTSDYALGPINFLNFSKLESEKRDLLFCYGIHPGYRMPRPAGFKHNIYFETEEPNGLSEGNLPHERGNWDFDFWTKIINVCPYSAKWENEVYNTDKFTSYVYPYDENNILEGVKKTCDVIYVGGLHGRHGIFHSLVNGILPFNYRFISMWNYPHVTHLNVNLYDKMKLWAESKITVCSNLLSENFEGQYKSAIPKLKNWQRNEAFKHIDKGLMPQMKPRISDAAVSKSLILILRDPWNVIETWFKPDEHFLYFDSPAQLPQKIDWCLNNWDYCQTIVDNMFNEFTKKYTTQKFYDYNLKEFDT